MGSKPVGISGSRAGAVLGISPWATPVDVWLQIMEDNQPGFCEANDYATPEPVDNAAVRWGSFFEGAIIKQAEKITKRKIGDRERFAENEFMTVHLDGVYDDECIHEGKTTTAYGYADEWGEDGTDRVPIQYQGQAQHAMMCWEAPMVRLSVLVFPCRQDDFESLGWHLTPSGDMRNGRRKLNPDTWTRVLAEMGFFHQYEIRQNIDVQDKMYWEYTRFWDHVVNQTPPVAGTYEDFRKIFRSVNATVVADERTERLSAEYRDINDELKRVNARKGQLKLALTEYMCTAADRAIDKDSEDKAILRDRTGRKLHQYNGRTFR